MAALLKEKDPKRIKEVEEAFSTFELNDMAVNLICHELSKTMPEFEVAEIRDLLDKIVEKQAHAK